MTAAVYTAVYAAAAVFPAVILPRTSEGVWECCLVDHAPRALPLNDTFRTLPASYPYSPRA